MIEALCIVSVGLVPPLLSVWMMRRAEARAQARLAAALSAARRYGFRQTELPVDAQQVEGIGYLIGDFTCRFNARSVYLRCGVNPFGPCEACPYYESI